jgi:hypothetical protein
VSIREKTVEIEGKLDAIMFCKAFDLNFFLSGSCMTLLVQGTTTDMNLGQAHCFAVGTPILDL